jgi:hypothetical protein
MPICTYYVGTHDVYLYKSAKTSSCEGRVVGVTYESLGQTTCYWVGQIKYNWMRVCARWGELSLNQGRGQDGRIREVLQKIAVQVCIDVYSGFMITLSLLESGRM